MSTGNIQMMIPFSGGIQVVFKVHGVEGARTYAYYGADAIAIESGADPADYEGVRDGGPQGGAGLPGSLGSDASDIGEVADIAEIGELLL
jgi:hypothetical protein